jgi:hypothetical protein
MSLYFIFVCILLLISVSINVFAFLRKKKTISKNITYDARALMADLSSGVALIEIKRIDPNHIFLKSPRELD